MAGIITVVIFIVTLVFTIIERRKLEKGQVSQDPLSVQQKILVWILCALNPIIAGAVMYYGWKKRWPIKAKTANHISLMVFLIQLVLFALWFFVVPSKKQAVINNTTVSNSDAQNVQRNIFGPDSDNDGVSDREEVDLAMNPNDPDTDDDGLNDGDEFYKYRTNYLDQDTDDDGFMDGDEVKGGYDPLAEGGQTSKSREEIKATSEAFMEEARRRSPEPGDSEVLLRDKGRVSAVYSFRLDLKMYYKMNGRFQIEKDKIILGREGAYELCNSPDGFQSDCPSLPISVVPQGQVLGGPDYTYQSIDGTNYIIEFELEEGFDEFSAGKHYATSQEFK